MIIDLKKEKEAQENIQKRTKHKMIKIILEDTKTVTNALDNLIDILDQSTIYNAFVYEILNIKSRIDILPKILNGTAVATTEQEEENYKKIKKVLTDCLLDKIK